MGYSLFLFFAITSVLFIPVIFFKVHTLSSIFFDFHFKSDVLNINIATMIHGFIISFFYALYNFHVFLLFIVHGLIVCCEKAKNIVVILCSIIIPVWFFTLRYTISDNYVFYLNAYIVLSIISGYSYKY